MQKQSARGTNGSISQQERRGETVGKNAMQVAMWSPASLEHLNGEMGRAFWFFTMREKEKVVKGAEVVFRAAEELPGAQTKQ